MSTITVKHYLNKRLKAKIIDKKEKFPLYVQIHFNAQKAQLKSNAFLDAGIETIYYSEIEFRNLNDFDLVFLNIEKKNIYDLIETLDNQNKEIDFANFSKLVKELTQRMYQLIENKLFNLFFIECKANDKSVPELFYNSEYSLINEAIDILDRDFDNDLSEFYKLCKEAYNIFTSNHVLINTMDETIYFMKLYEWKFKNGKKDFLRIACNFGNSFTTPEETEEYYNEVIKSIDKLID